MPVTKVRSGWDSGNLEFTLASDRSVKLGGVVALTGATTTSAADSLAQPITHRYVGKTTGADAEALTLANGSPGQVITISLVVDGNGTGTLTPATATGFVSVALADAGDTVTLQYIDDTVGWILIGYYGVAAPPTVAIT